MRGLQRRYIRPRRPVARLRPPRATATSCTNGPVPTAVLGTVLFISDAQPGLGQLRQQRGGRAWLVLGATAAVSVWHVAAGMVVGLLLQQALRARAPDGNRLG